MAKYYVNDTSQSNGDHEVHKEGCRWLTMARSKTFLGNFDNCRDAVGVSKQLVYPTSDGCKHCCPNCHTS